MTSDFRFCPTLEPLVVECGVEVSRENIGDPKEYGVDDASPLRLITRGSEISTKSSLQSSSSYGSLRLTPAACSFVVVGLEYDQLPFGSIVTCSADRGVSRRISETYLQQSATDFEHMEFVGLDVLIDRKAFESHGFAAYGATPSRCLFLKLQE